MLRARAASADAAYRSDGGDSQRWLVRAATVAGVRHRLEGQGGQDAFAWSDAPDGLVVAVADGVSATPQAALAATVAVDGACGVEVGERAPSAVAVAAVDAAASALSDALGDTASGAATLVVAVVTPDGSWASSRVGDADAFVVEGREWRPVFPVPVDDDVRSGATDVVGAPGAQRQDATGRLSPGQALVLVSDGVAGPLRDGPNTVAVGVADALGDHPSPLELARLVDFARQGCHDDRTLLAVWLGGGEG